MPPIEVSTELRRKITEALCEGLAEQLKTMADELGDFPEHQQRARAAHAAWIGTVPADTARLDWMETNLLRKGAEMHFADGDRIKPRHAWAVAGELATLRETIDCLMAHGATAFARGGGDG